MPAIKNVFLPNSIVLVTEISEDGLASHSHVQSLLVLLNSVPKPSPPGQLIVGTNLNDPPLIATQIGNVYLQFTPEATGGSAEVFIRGYAALPEGTRAAIVTRACGQTFTTDPAAILDEQSLFLTSFEAPVPASGGLLLTIFLLVEREIVEGGLPAAMLNVEGLDVNVKLGSKIPT